MRENTASRLGRHVRELTRHGPRHHDHPIAVAATLGYLTGCLSGSGYEVVREVYGPGPADVNLLATRAGTGGGPLLEVGAHWDTVPTSPGADDNGSAVAALLELARVTAAGPPPARGVRFCVFGGEDGDTAATACVGSRAHVASLDPAVGDIPGGRVEGAIVLEMVGYRDVRPGSQQLPADLAAAVPPPVPDRGDFVAVLADPAAGPYLAALVTAGGQVEPALPLLALTVPPSPTGTVARSDHSSYWAAGLPAVMVTDTAEFRNPHYHRATDVLDTLDLDFAAQVTRVVAAAVQSLTSA